MPLRGINNRSLQFRIYFLALVTLSVTTGCRDASQKQTIPVTGKVNFKGQPLAGATVFFVPDSGPRATGETNAKGEFRLMTYRPGDGAVVGDFKVGITKYVADPATAKDPVPGMKNEIPEKYGNPASSGLTAKVETGKKIAPTFDLSE